MVFARFLPLLPILLFLRVDAVAQCCTHILSLHDSYGDNWNGATIQVSINGQPIGTWYAWGAGGAVPIDACDGDVIELHYSSQDGEEQNSYELFDESGNVLFADGPSPQPGVVYSGIAACGVTPVPGTVPCSALPIDAPDCLTVDNSGAAGTGIEPGCAEYAGGDRWFTLPVPESGTVNVSTNDIGGLDHSGIGLWTGPDCFNLTKRACGIDSASAFELPQGQTVYIQVFGFDGGTGPFDLCASDPGPVTVDNSELPIVSLFTLGQEIPADGKVDALMEIRYNGPGTLTFMTDAPNVYAGNIGIGLRGASSAGYPQKPYSLETRDGTGANLDVSLLGMPEENDWVLLSNYNDRSLVRNELAYHLARRLGQYAPRTHLCEVLLDNAYRGIYVLAERIKRDSGRVDIAKLTGDENEGDDVTGGYILQQNYHDPDNSFQSNYSPLDHPGFDVHFVYEYPAPDTITSPQRAYIAAFVDSLESALYGDDFIDPGIGYRNYLDVPSFINYFLVNELSRNNDGFKKSVFFHKDKNSDQGRLKAGPVWDFDWAWKNVSGCDIFDNTDGSGWAHLVNDCPTDNYSCGWYLRLLQDSTFVNELRCTYDQYRATELSYERIAAFIDSVGARVQNAQARHFEKWPILGTSGPAPEVFACAATHHAELDTLKNWIAQRLAWLDVNLPGVCMNVGITGSPVTALHCYPDPTTGTVRFSGLLGSMKSRSIGIMDVTGREVERIIIPPGVSSIEHTMQRSGTYLIMLLDGPNVLRCSRFVVL